MQRLKRIAIVTAAVFVASVDSTTVFASLINVFFSYGLSSDQQAVISSAGDYWNNILTGYQPGIEDMRGVSITVSGRSDDGAGGVLARTSNTYLCRTVGSKTYALAETGSITIDIADIGTLYDSGFLYAVVLHEMAHAIGFGTLWDANGLYDAQKDPGCYVGAAGTAAFHTEFGGTGSVPVELGGGNGTANCHWDEVDGGLDPTPYYDSHGRNMRDELMTGWIDIRQGSSPYSLFFSQTTIHQFEDLGYTILKVSGDANLDGSVNATDLNTVLSNYNLSGVEWADGDFNGDDSVNGTDLNAVLSNYNQNNDIYGIYSYGGGGGASSSMAVPEPATMSLLLGGAMVLAGMLRRRRYLSR